MENITTAGTGLIGQDKNGQLYGSVESVVGIKGDYKLVTSRAMGSRSNERYITILDMYNNPVSGLHKNGTFNWTIRTNIDKCNTHGRNAVGMKSLTIWSGYHAVDGVKQLCKEVFGLDLRMYTKDDVSNGVQVGKDRRKF